MDDMSRMWVDALEQAGFTTHYARKMVEKVLRGEDQDDQEDAVNDLITFLRARLGEDEQAARAATPGPWLYDAGRDEAPDGTGRVDPAIQLGDRTVIDDSSGISMGDMEHIARHDPDRVLAEVAAKRMLVDVCEDRGHGWANPNDRFVTGFAAGLETALKLVAKAYNDHPDWQAKWGEPAGKE